MAQQHSCQLGEAAVRGAPACLPLEVPVGRQQLSSADYLWLGIYFLATENLICFQILHPLPTCHPSRCAPPLPSVSSPSPPISSQPMCFSSPVPGSRHHLRHLSSLPVAGAKLAQMSYCQCHELRSRGPQAPELTSRERRVDLKTPEAEMRARLRAAPDTRMVTLRYSEALPELRGLDASANAEASTGALSRPKEEAVT